jgi:hypothetical protein
MSFAAMTGAMQHNPIGFPAAWNAQTFSLTVGSTVMSAPCVAKLLRFFAAPNPPEILMGWLQFEVVELVEKGYY